jgi:hypothetical protein
MIIQAEQERLLLLINLIFLTLSKFSCNKRTNDKLIFSLHNQDKWTFIFANFIKISEGSLGSSI